MVNHPDFVGLEGLKYDPTKMTLRINGDVIDQGIKKKCSIIPKITMMQCFEYRFGRGIETRYFGTCTISDTILE